ncbi:MAG: hypothetical protein HWE39_03905 [Oceanospirillaceae bacterium]|nr:hypothetical protein [Oceanospirillaceae bacterium]
MRDIRAEGDWETVYTEMVEPHQSSDVAPYHEGRLSRFASFIAAMRSVPAGVSA